MDADLQRCDDESLLEEQGAQRAEAFAVFYDRHVRRITRFHYAATRDVEVAADLTAETFAAALEGRRRFDRRHGTAANWVHGIARRKLARYRRDRSVESRARARYGWVPLELSSHQIAELHRDLESELSRITIFEELAGLPSEQRDAVVARVLLDCQYDQIATAVSTSPAAARKRVSRGLATLRSRIERNMS